MKPRAHGRDEYTADATEGAHSLALGLATALGDLTDTFVLIGGLVPSLICPRPDDDAKYGPHLGTLDVDVAFTRALLDEGTYDDVVARLRSIDLEPDPTPGRAPSRSRWRVRSRPDLKADFLLERSGKNEKAGSPKRLTPDFAPILIDGVHLATQSARNVVLAGTTHDGAKAERPVRVCSAGALSVLKAIAFRARAFGKDAYDLAYVLEQRGSRWRRSPLRCESTAKIRSCERPSRFSRRISPRSTSWAPAERPRFWKPTRRPSMRRTSSRPCSHSGGPCGCRAPRRKPFAIPARRGPVRQACDRTGAGDLERRTDRGSAWIWNHLLRAIRRADATRGWTPARRARRTQGPHRVAARRSKKVGTHR